MKVNWRKTTIVVLDIAIMAYLVLAVTAFNKPDVRASLCSEVRIDIADVGTKGFLEVADVRNYLERLQVYPEAQPMKFVSSRKIEETLCKSPYIKSAECYKTQSGHVCISLVQRSPILRVMANNGDDYYLDAQGDILPHTRYHRDLIVATGWISRDYARTQLTAVGNTLLGNPFWQRQVVQINVLFDGTVELVPRVGDHIAYLGDTDDLERKLDRLRKFYKYGLSQAGWNKYSRISVEFDNQIICKKAHGK
jgi:cell division protein FtsQ